MTHQFIPISASEIRFIRERWYRVAILPKFDLAQWRWFNFDIEGRYTTLDMHIGRVGSVYLEKEEDVVLFRLTWL